MAKKKLNKKKEDLTIQMINDFIKDENMAKKEYKEIAMKFKPNSLERKRFLSMSKDEAKHEKYLQEIKEQMYFVKIAKN